MIQQEELYKQQSEELIKKYEMKGIVKKYNVKIPMRPQIQVCCFHVGY